ncbi:MAG: peptidase M16 [Flavobacteriales bacterium]|nr:peptidase M16 [Flavobacteriales bacterium]
MRNIAQLITTILALVFIGYVIMVSINSEHKEFNYQYATVENDPLNTIIYTLDNGLKVYMSINQDEPRIQTNIAVNTGSKQDPSDATGLAHYLEHMLFKGTSKIGTVDWEKESKELKKISDLYEERRGVTVEDERKEIYHQIDSISSVAATYAVANEYDKMISSLGAKGTNAYTSLERTVYINDIPSNELEKWLIIESERFSELVLRLFHTELETVYEEFNRGQDNDWRLAWYAMMKALFKKHQYGTQSTIGTSEHLKNPSMEKIHEYFNEKYVPNNMAIILSGDINPDKTIRLIEKYFGHFKSKEVPKFTVALEDPIDKPEVINVTGSSSEWIDIGFRLPGVSEEDIYILPLLDGILSNGKAGLIDLNLVKSQNILSGYSQYMIAKDYSLFKLHGEPRQGQSLEEVKGFLLNELEKIKNGEFEEWMLSAIIKNFKLDDQKRNESNSYRARKMTDAFIMNQDWRTIVHQNEKLSNVTKEDIIRFSKKYFDNNYVVVNKLHGKPNSIKVEKPKITTIPLNRDTASNFAINFHNIQSSRLRPVYNDYNLDIKKFSIKNNTLGYYVKNTTNEVFSLSYIIDMGKLSDKELALAVSYLEYLGTDQYDANEIEQEMFKLGLSYSVFASDERVYVQLSGLEESIEQGIQLFEHILSNVQPSQAVYDNMILDILRERTDNKLSKWSISSGMRYYAKYGAHSSFNHMLAIDDLKSINVDSLTKKITKLMSFEHYIYYYGRKDVADVKSLLDQYHNTPKHQKPTIPAITFKELTNTNNKVYFVDYDMVQSEVTMLSKGNSYDKNLIPLGKLFNEYFGSGLSSIVFQEIRESKALAYSARSYFSTPSKLNQSHYITAYLGTQVDKLQEATISLLDLMNNMPEVAGQFEDAKIAALKKIETSRTKSSQLFWNYLRAKELGFEYDINKDIYPALKKLTLADLKLFFDEHIKNKNYTFLVLGNKDMVDQNALKELGNYEELDLDEIFGY